jgi:hypothetical protein
MSRGTTFKIATDGVIKFIKSDTGGYRLPDWKDSDTKWENKGIAICDSKVTYMTKAEFFSSSSKFEGVWFPWKDIRDSLLDDTYDGDDDEDEDEYSEDEVSI